MSYIPYTDRISYTDRATILHEALPYIKMFQGTVIVIKYGGNAMTSPELRRSVMEDIVLLAMVGIRVVVVHGGGPEINEMLRAIGKEPKFINGLRYTDEETMDIVQMVLCGKVGKNLAQAINQGGGKAISVSGIDAEIIQAKQHDPKLGLVGDTITINPEPINLLLSGGYTPVISTVATGYLGDEGKSYNINADNAASEIAISLGARKLVLLTDIEGLRSNPDDETSLVSKTNLQGMENLMESGAVTGGMIPKLKCCKESLERGVKHVHILDGRYPHSILIELLTKKGMGTMITRK